MIVVVVLAAGEGRRFGGPVHKLRSVLDGVPVVRRAVDAAVGSGIGAVVVVTGAVDLDDLLPPDVAVVHNAGWASGQASSLRAGVAEADRRGAEAVVVGLGDMPFVPAAAWRAVAAAGGDLVTARFSGYRSPPVRIARSLWADLPSEGDEGARELMRRRPGLVTSVDVEGRATDVDSTIDLDPG